MSAAQLSPIRAEDLGHVGRFLHRNLNPRLSAGAWSRAVVPSWPVDAPNHGVMLTEAGRVVGVYLAFYSRREVAGQTQDFCNLGAWCVLDDHRADSVRMLRWLLRQPGYTFTDLSPSGNVIGLNERLRFRSLDTRTMLLVNRPRVRRARYAVVTDPAAIARLLPAHERRILHDHQGAAATHHLLLAAEDEQCYVIYRRDRRKRLPIFATLLHVSDGEVLARAVPELAHHLLVHDRVPCTLAELRVLGTMPPGARLLRSARPKMFRSTTLGPESIDDLYSELTCVAW